MRRKYALVSARPVRLRWRLIAVVVATMTVAANFIAEAVPASATPGNGDGSYVWQNPLPNGTHALNAISCASSSFCVAVGDGIAATVDGANWTSRVHSETNLLAGVSCPDSGHCFAVGASGTILASSDAGETWSSQTSAITSNLNAISCYNANNCIAAGASGKILSTTNGGSSWTSTSVASSQLNGVSCASATTCWAVGSVTGGNTGVYKTTNGTSWSSQSNPGTTDGQSVSCPTTASCALVAGTSVLQTTDGATWTTYSGLTASAVSCVASATLCLGVSSTQLQTFTLGGSAGTAFSLGVGYQPSQASCPSSTICFLVEANGGTAKATIASNNVSAVTSNSLVNTGGWTGIACPAVATCYASEPTGIAKTTQPEVSWSLLPSVAGLGGNAIACPTIAVCVAAGNSGYLWRTVNGGTSWTRQANGLTSANLLSISCASATSCVAVGASGTIAYTSDGSTWSLATSFNGSNSINGVSCVASTTTCFAVSGAYLGYSTTAFSSATWTQLNTLNTTQVMNSINCPSTGFCAAVGNAGTIRVSSAPTGAGNWTAPTSTGTTQPLNSISCPSATACYAVGAAGTAVDQKTSPSGTWTARTTNMSSNLTTVACNIDCWIAGGDSILSNSAPSASASQAALSPTTPRTGSSSTITATLYDGAGLPIVGDLVSVTSSRGASDTISEASTGSSYTNPKGVATFQITSTTPGTATLTVKDTTSTPNVTISTSPLITFVSAYSSAVLADSPAAYWRFDETSGTSAADASGNGQIGTYNGGYTQGVSGVLVTDPDPALTLDGSSGYVSASTLTALQGDNARTLEVWFKTTDARLQPLVDSGATGTNGTSFALGLTSNNGISPSPPVNTPGAYLRIWGADVYVPNLYLADGRAHQLVVTLSGSLAGLWVDGSLPQAYLWNGSSWSSLQPQPIALGLTPNTTGNPVWIGQGRSFGSNWFDGTIDEVSVYSTALSSSRITTHWQSAGYVPSAPGNVTATAGSYKATVSWTAPTYGGSSPIINYVVTPYLGTQALPTVSALIATSVTVNNLGAGSTYTFTVTAVNDRGSGPASSASSAVTINGSTAYMSSVTSDTPKIYWRLDEASGTTAADSSGNNVSGTYNGGVTLNQPGLLYGDADAAVVLNGTSGYVSAPTQTFLQVDNTRSVEIWFSTTSTTQQPLYDSGTTGTGQAEFQIGLIQQGGLGGNGFANNPPGVLVDFTNIGAFVPANVTDGLPHQVVMTLSGTTLYIYIDGQTPSGYNFQVCCGSWAYTSQPFALGNTPNTTGNPIWVGQSRNQVGLGHNVGATFFTGTMDEVALYSTALPSGRVVDHWNKAANAPGAPTGVSASAGPSVGYVSWTAPAVSGRNPITSYTITPSPLADGTSPTSVDASATAATVYALNPGTNYTFTVVANSADGPGQVSAASGSITPTGNSNVYKTAVLGDSPTAYWRLDESSGTSAADATGHGNTATYNGGYTLGQLGLLASDPDAGVVLNGSSGYISAPTLTPLQGDNTRTVELWFQTTDSRQQPLFDSGAYSNLADFMIGLTTTNGVGGSPAQNTPGAYLQLYNDDMYVPGLNLADGRAHQILVTLSGTTVYFYVDGQLPAGYVYGPSSWSALLAQPFSLPSTPNSTSNAILIGQSRGQLSGSGSTWFDGTVDDVSVYSTALSASQVATHWVDSGYPPGPPTGVSATAGSNQATVTLIPPSNFGTSAVASYVITPYLGTVPLPTTTATASATSAVVTGLSGGSSYTFKVTAKNANYIGPASSASSSITVTGTTYAYSSTVTGDTPSAYWRLDETSGSAAADASGNGHTGTYNGGFQLNALGLLQSDPDAALALNLGNVGYVSAGSLTPLQGANTRSVELWLKTGDGEQMPLLDSGNSGTTTATAFVIGLTTTNGVNNSPPQNTPGLYFGTNNDDVYLPGLNLASSHPHQVVLTLSGTTVYIYVDGQTPAGTVWNGSSWSAMSSQPFTLPTTPNTTSNPVWIGQSRNKVQGQGPTNFNGVLDDVSVYSTALTSTQVLNHWKAGGHAATAPTNVTGTAGQYAAQVSWTAPAGSGDSAISGYVVQAINAGNVASTVNVSADATAAAVPSLSPALSYSFNVTATNANNYTGLVGSSSGTITPSGPAASAGSFGTQYFYSDDGNDGNQAKGRYGLVTQANVPALSTWTIEGWIGDQSSYGVTSSNAAWGMLQGTTTNPSQNSPAAGINFNLGGNPLQTVFVWPGGQSSALAGDSSGIATAFNTSNYSFAAISYDGSTVRCYVNGSQVCSTATTGAALAAGPAGWMDEVALRQTKFDEFRISNIARYTGASMTVPTSEFPNNEANTMVLWHLNDYGLAKLPATAISNGLNYQRLGAFGDFSGHNNHGAVIGINDSAWIIGPPTFSLYSLAPGVTPSELAGGGSPWICPCTRAATNYPVDTATGEFYHTFSDFQVPGRGLPLDLERTYSSLNASTLGRFGYGWTDSYAMSVTISGSIGVSGSTATVKAGNGSSVVFTSNGSAWVGPAHVLASLTMSGSNYVFTDKSKSIYTYNSSGLLTQETDRNNYSTTLAYNGSNQLTTVTDPAGRTLTFNYSGSLVSSVSDSASPSRTVSYAYDGSNNLTQVTDVRGANTAFTYDASHELLTMKDPNCLGAGATCMGVRNTYSSGKVSQQIDNLNRVTTFSYATTAIGINTTTTDPNGNQTLDVYANNVLVSETRGYGTSVAATTNYAFDPGLDALTSVTDPDGNSSVTARDAQANVLSTTDTLGRTSSYTYNSFNEVLTAKDALGVTTTNTYDGNGNLTQTSTPLVGSSPAVSKTTNYTYGDTTHPRDLTQVTDPDSKNWTYTYDSYGDKASATDPLGDKTTYAYDSLGRLTSKVTPLGNVSGGIPADYTWSYTYNPAGQLLTSSDPLGNTAQKTYDSNGNLLNSLDASGNATRYAYDLDNEVTSESDGYGSTSQRTLKTTYDADGNVHQQVDGLGNVTAYSYDALSRMSAVSDPLHRTTNKHYDAAGNLTSLVDAKGQTTSYAYDAANQLVSISYSSPSTPAVAYGYDLDGQRTSMQDGTGPSSYSYDSLHRITQTTDGAGNQLQYGYDLKGQTTSITYPGGTNKVTQGFDDAGRLTTIADWLSHTTTYTYDANSNNYEIDYGNGAIRSSSFDFADRLMGSTDSKSGSAFLTLTYSRAPNSVLTGDGSNTYGYDPLNRVTAANSSNYSYDAADEWTQKTVSGGNTTTLAYDIANEVTSLTVTNGPTQVSKLTYSYDANGNRIRSIDQNNNNTVYTWDQANRLVGYAAGATTASYAYNGDGLLTSQTTSSGTTGLVWNTAASLPLIMKAGSTSYILGPNGLPIEQVTGSGSAYFYHADQIGNTRALTDSTGIVQDTWVYDPYGTVTSSTGSVANLFQFQGQYLDATTGLYYLRARYYDPVSAQFGSRDRFVSGTRQPYTYGKDSPVSASDITGNWSVGVCLSTAVQMIIAAFFQGCYQTVVDPDTGQVTTGFTETVPYIGTDATPESLGTPSLSVLSAGVQFSDANDVSQLSGPFAYVGGGNGLVSGDYFQSPNHPPGCGGVHGINLGVGPGTPWPQANGGISETFVEKKTTNGWKTYA